MEESTYFQLLAREQAHLERVAWAMLGRRSDVEDAVQEAALAGYIARGQLRDVGAFGAWIRRILVRKCSDLMRVRQATILLPLIDQGVEPPFDPSAREIWTTVHRLPDHLRAVIVMKYLLDLPQQEIADTLGIPLGTVKSRLNAGLERLRRELRESGEVAAHGL